MTALLNQIVSLDPSGIIGTGAHYIESQFGTIGVIAALILCLSILTLVVGKLLKILFNVVRYVAIPSVVVAFVATLFLPYPFAYILPAAVAVFSMVLIVKS
ncbi:MAG: hypothetical protein WBP29_15215 [Candidatus Zixiibacteriota bacterium]